jgi:spermidine/putrescine transport system permease protein
VTVSAKPPPTGSVSDLGRTPTRLGRVLPVLAPALLATPLTLWLLALVTLPIGIFFVYSFWRVRNFQIVHSFWLGNYRSAFGSLFLSAVESSLIIGLSAALLSCAGGFVLAWVVRFRLRRTRNLALLAIVAVSAGSYLARIYSWRAVLGSNGLINSGLIHAGVTDQPLTFLLFNRFAIVTALVNLFLPYAFLPIYANLLAMDSEVIEAGRVLGAGPWTNFRRVILPMASVGLAISFIYVMIFATGDFAIPTFLGGATGLPAAAVIQSQFGTSFNWPLGAAMSFVYIVILGAIAGALAFYANRVSRRMAM